MITLIVSGYYAVMANTVEAQINPVAGAEVEVVTLEERRAAFPYIGGVGSMLWRYKWKRIILGASAVVLGVSAATECSKPLFPQISADLPSLSTFPVLYQLSSFFESPLGVSSVLAISAISLGAHAIKGSERFKAIERALREVQISPIRNTPPPPNP